MFAPCTQACLLFGLNVPVMYAGMQLCEFFRPYFELRSPTRDSGIPATRCSNQLVTDKHRNKQYGNYSHIYSFSISYWNLNITFLKLCTSSVPKYKHLLTSTDHVWPFVLFKNFMKILFILLWKVLLPYTFKVYLNCFYFFSIFLNKANGQTWSAEVNKCLYFGTEVVHTTCDNDFKTNEEITYQKTSKIHN